MKRLYDLLGIFILDMTICVDEISLSGSGANGLMIDTMKELGPDSFVGRMSCVVRGASDTTFYILAVYFGSVGITKTRNAVTCGLIADFSGIIAAILISYLFFF